jgi:hypothetical protein
MPGGIVLADRTNIVPLYGPTVPATAAPKYISLKDAEAVEILVFVLNGSTVTGSAVTLNQATAVAGTSAKALGFTRYYTQADPANSSTWTNSTAVSNTFTTPTNNSLQIAYRIPIDPSSLDVANSFDCVSIALANATNATIVAVAQIRPKFGGIAVGFPDARLD